METYRPVLLLLERNAFSVLKNIGMLLLWRKMVLKQINDDVEKVFKG
jgi:hypothetical protein